MYFSLVKGHQGLTHFDPGSWHSLAVALLPAPIQLTSTSGPLSDLLHIFVLPGLSLPRATALAMQKCGELAPSGAILSQWQTGLARQILQHPCSQVAQGVDAFHTISKGSSRNWSPLPTAVTCSLMWYRLAFFPALPHSPSNTSWDRFPSKITYTQISVPGSAFGANAA